jgi:hypothetical protein
MSLSKQWATVPMYLFFNIALGLNDFQAGKSITRAIVRVGPKNRDFFGPWNGNEQVPFGPCNPYVPRHKNNKYIVHKYDACV